MVFSLLSLDLSVAKFPFFIQIPVILDLGGTEVHPTLV